MNDLNYLFTTDVKTEEITSFLAKKSYTDLMILKSNIGYKKLEKALSEVLNLKKRFFIDEVEEFERLHSKKSKTETETEIENDIELPDSYEDNGLFKSVSNV